MEIINPDAYQHQQAKSESSQNPKRGDRETYSIKDITDTSFASAQERLSSLIDDGHTAWDELRSSRSKEGKKWTRSYYPTELVIENLRQEDPALAKLAERFSRVRKGDTYNVNYGVDTVYILHWAAKLAKEDTHHG